MLAEDDAFDAASLEQAPVGEGPLRPSLVARSGQRVLAVLLSLGLVAACVPTVALAQDHTATAGSSLAADQDEETDPGEKDSSSSMSTLSKHAWWKSAYGTEYFYFKNKKYYTADVCPDVKEVGIDVSQWNGKIDWKKVKKDGVTFAIIRVGYGTDKKSQDDKQWKNNIKGALKAGLKVGVYLYSYAYDKKTAKSEAKHVLRCLEKAGVEPDDLALPVYLDMEETWGGHPCCRGHVLSNKKLAKIADTFCSKIEDAGYRVGIYANTVWWVNYLTDKKFTKGTWSRWVAQYNYECVVPMSTEYGKTLDIWQFCASGHVDGIGKERSHVDMNYLFVDAAEAGTQKKEAGATTRKTYKITYKLNGGTNNEDNPGRYKKSKSVKLKDPERPGYKFKGWYTKKNFKKSSKVKKVKGGNVTVYAKWEKKSFRVAYETNGGTMPDGAKTSFKVDTATFKFAIPTRAGYTFAGWYDDKALTEPIAGVVKGTCENKRVYAKWVKNPEAVECVVPAANVYETSTSTEVIDHIAQGETVVIVDEANGRGKLEDGRGWVELADVTVKEG